MRPNARRRKTLCRADRCRPSPRPPPAWIRPNRGWLSPVRRIQNPPARLGFRCGIRSREASPSARVPSRPGLPERTFDLQAHQRPCRKLRPTPPVSPGEFLRGSPRRRWCRRPRVPGRVLRPRANPCAQRGMSAGRIRSPRGLPATPASPPGSTGSGVHRRRRRRLRWSPIAEIRRGFLRGSSDRKPGLGFGRRPGRRPSCPRDPGVLLKRPGNGRKSSVRRTRPPGRGPAKPGLRVRCIRHGTPSRPCRRCRCPRERASRRVGLRAGSPRWIAIGSASRKSLIPFPPSPLLKSRENSRNRIRSGRP